MSPTGDRASFFPAIEKKYGQPMSHWFEVMKTIESGKYAEQIDYLRSEFGFTRQHANALVLYSRGSTTSRRFTSLDEYLAGHDEIKQATVREIFAAIQSEFPVLELVIAWNTPILKCDDTYVFGVSALSKHLLLAPYDVSVLDDFRPRLAHYQVNKKTFRVPVDWDVDRSLLREMVAASLGRLRNPDGGFGNQQR